MRQLLAELRGTAPKRPLTYGESLNVGRVQAARLRHWAGADQPDINLIWLVRQRLIPVNFAPSYKLGEQSGLTTDQISGRLEIFINSGEPELRQRFSLLHEFKHVLDFEDALVLHAKLGVGDHGRRRGLIEAVANDFAAHVLMPTPLVKREWVRWQDLGLMAEIFKVSVEAMNLRLEKLGLISDPQPKPRMYFRRTSTPIADTCCTAA